MTILPMRDLKDTVEIERRCKEEGGPIFITKNGYGRLVVMDMEYYESMAWKMQEARLLNDGLKDIEEGRVYDGKTVMAELGAKYGF